MTGDVDSGTARLGEKLAERCPGGAEGDGPQTGSVERVGQRAAQVTAADGLGVDHPHTGKDEAWLRVAGAEWRQSLDMTDQFSLGGRKGERCVNPQLGDKALMLQPIAQSLDQKLPQGVEPFGRDREAGCHRMAAAINQQPRLSRRYHRWAERNATD